MKNFKIVILIICLLLTCSCKNDMITMTEKLADKIVEAHKSSTVDTSDMNKEEQRLFYTFIDSQILENKIINISENIEFSDQSDTSAPNTNGLYEKDGNYYIKYTDIKWEKVENDYRATISLNNKEAGLFKSLVPILYDDTYNNDKYNYIYMNKNKTDNSLEYYYKSITDGSGLIIRFYLNKNKISKISTIYQDIYYEPEITDKNSSIVLQTIVLIIIVIFTVSLVVVAIKRI